MDDEDRMAAERAMVVDDKADDPMQGLEGLDVAGPKPEGMGLGQSSTKA